MKKIKTVLYALISLVVVSPLVFATQASALSWVQTYNYKTLNGTHLVQRIVTPDGSDVPYIFKERTNNVKITAPSTNTGGNLREFFWPANSPDAQDSTSCAKWSSQTDALTQQGIAARIIDTPAGTRGVTVTKNIFYYASWVFNVHVWDTSRPGEPYTQIASFDMSEVVGNFDTGMQPFPWSVCTRVVGQNLQLKVWLSSSPQPSWNDSKHVRSTTMPIEWVQPGKTGWYIGHVKPGQIAEFQNLQTWAGF
jgi:hypothetical protein